MRAEELLERLNHLEHGQDALHAQNRVLAAAVKGLLHAMPADAAQDAAEAVQLAFEDELAELDYHASPLADAFREAAEAFFRAKR